MSYMKKKLKLDNGGYLKQMHIEYDLGHMYVWLEGSDPDEPPNVALQFISLSSVNNGKHYAYISIQDVSVVSDDMLKIIRMGKQYAKKLDKLVK